MLDDTVAIDAGSLTSGMELAAQSEIEAVLVSHAHLDHIRDLATIADNRNQYGAPPLIVAGTKQTIAILKKHFFNGLLWPDFSKIPSARRPAIKYLELTPEKPVTIAGYRVCAIPVSHTIECCAFTIRGRDGTLAYSGDTGPTDRLWEVLSETEDLKALLMEVSFPNREQKLATVSGHHTPKTLGAELKKYRAPKDLPTMLYHIKPVFQSEVEKECVALKGVNLHVLNLKDQFVL